MCAWSWTRKAVELWQSGKLCEIVWSCVKLCEVIGVPNVFKATCPGAKLGSVSRETLCVKAQRTKWCSCWEQRVKLPLWRRRGESRKEAEKGRAENGGEKEPGQLQQPQHQLKTNKNENKHNDSDKQIQAGQWQQPQPQPTTVNNPRTRMNHSPHNIGTTLTIRDQSTQLCYSKSKRQTFLREFWCNIFFLWLSNLLNRKR
jgi:hypothetical protein